MPPSLGLTIHAEADGEAGGAHAVGGGTAVRATVLRPLGIAHGEVGPRPAALQPVLGGARGHLALLRVVPAHLGTQLGAAALPARQPRLAALQHRHLAALHLQLGDICALRGAAGSCRRPTWRDDSGDGTRGRSPLPSRRRHSVLAARSGCAATQTKSWPRRLVSVLSTRTVADGVGTPSARPRPSHQRSVAGGVPPSQRHRSITYSSCLVAAAMHVGLPAGIPGKGWVVE